MTGAPHPIRRAMAQQFSWLTRRYIQAITCDGLLSYTELHPDVYTAIMVSDVCFTYSDEFWNEERSNCEFLKHMDTQKLQSFWLFLLAGATEHGDIYFNVAPEFCQLFAGDFHYQRPWVEDDDTSQQSPMQLALRSFDALRTFYFILITSGIDIVHFTELECMMPWCAYTQETLMDLFSLQHPSCT